MPRTKEEKGAEFRALHEGEPFVIPNPWDAGSAKVLSALGFKALATTSSGFAFTLGRRDGNVSLDEVVAHVAELAGAVDVPISVDLENGYGAAPEKAVEAINRVGEAGAVGGSIEDYDPDDDAIYPIEQATERIAAAAEAARGLDFPFTLTGRAENHIRDNQDLDDTIARLKAYEEAGADVVYAPGLGGVDDIRAVCDAASRPVNVLARPGLTAAEIFDAGAQRISLGGWLAFTAVDTMAKAAVEVRDQGEFGSLSVPRELREWLGG